MLIVILLGPGLSQAQTLRVFAASSLADAFTDLAAVFEARHPGVELELNFGGSATLGTQLLLGAGADVFASADLVQMDRLVSAGLVSEPAPFASNRLVGVAYEASDLAELVDLAKPGTLIALAGPEVPAGRYARTLLTSLNDLYGPDFAQGVLGNLVSEETNVRQVAAKVQLGEADAALVYATDAASYKGLRILEVPQGYDIRAVYPVAILKDSPQATLAQAFVEFVLHEDGQSVLKAHGFEPK